VGEAGRDCAIAFQLTIPAKSDPDPSEIEIDSSNFSAPNTTDRKGQTSVTGKNTRKQPKKPAAAKQNITKQQQLVEPEPKNKVTENKSAGGSGIAGAKTKPEAKKPEAKKPEVKKPENVTALGNDAAATVGKKRKSWKRQRPEEVEVEVGCGLAQI
jgi:hypothetical protein